MEDKPKESMLEQFTRLVRDYKYEHVEFDMKPMGREAREAMDKVLDDYFKENPVKITPLKRSHGR